MSKLVKSTFIYSLGSILPRIASFFLLPLYTRYLSPADFGIVQSMLVFSTIIMVFFSLAMDNSIYRLYYENNSEESKRNLLGTIFISIFFVSLVLTSALFIFNKFTSQVFQTIPFFPYYAYSILFSFFNIFGIIPRIYFQLKEKPEVFITISIVQFIFATGLILYFVVAKNEGATGMLKGQMIGAIFMVPWFIILLSKIINIKFNYSILKGVLAYSLPMIPAILSAWVLNLSDRIFIERNFNLEEVGVYSLGYKIAEIVLIFSSSFNVAYNAIYFKLASSVDQVNAKKQLYKYNNIYVMLLMILIFITILFSKEIISMLFDERYIEAYRIIQIVAIGFFFSHATGLSNFAIYQEKKTLVVMFIMIFCALLNLLLNFLFIPKLGMYGAAYATSISFFIQFVINYLYSKKYYFIPLNFRNMIYAFLIMIAIFLPFSLIEIDIIFSLVIKLVIVFGIILFATKKYYKNILYIINSK